MIYKFKVSALLTILTMIFLVMPNSSSLADTYKVGDNCQDIAEVDYPKGLWCALDLEGTFTFWEVPYQIDQDSAAILTKDIEAVDCTKTATRAECEALARKVATQTIVGKFALTNSQAESILSCYRFDGFSGPFDFSEEGIYLDDGPWESGAPRFCYWYKYPEASAAERFNNLDFGAKFSILIFVLFAIFLFVIFFDAFSPKTKEKGLGSLSARTAKTILAMAGVALGIVFMAWLYIALVEPLFSGTKIDFSRKIFGIPQYMLSFMYGMYFLIWNSNRKK